MAVTRITDITLNRMEAQSAESALIRKFYRLLFICGVDFVEITPAILAKLGEEVNPSKTVIKFDDVFEADLAGFGGFKRLICRYSGLSLPSRMEFEACINDIRELNALEKYGGHAHIRITGLDDILLYDHQKAFAKIKGSFSGNIELCPQNQYDFATALAVEWLKAGGKSAASSFLGVGGFAATEEVLMALRVNEGWRPGADLSAFRELKALAEKMFKIKVDPRKSVVGEAIFHVESGIHVDGIIKKTANFEPFPPEAVGAKRKIVLGKHSGKSSIAAKLRKYRFEPADEEAIQRLLERVRDLSIRLGRSISDGEFIELAQELGRRKEEGPRHEGEKISD